MKFDSSYLNTKGLLTWLSTFTISLFIIALPWYIFLWSELQQAIVSELLGSTMIAGFFIPSFLLLMIIHLLISKPDGRFRLNLVDYLVLLSGVFILGHWSFSGFSNIDPFLMIRITLTYSVYGLIRISRMPGRWILLTCFFSIFLQSLYGLYEYSQPVVSHDFIPINEINGSFSNSGPFGGYMALGLILCGTILQKKPIKNLNWIIGILGIPILVCCILSDSRAAWIAVFVGIIYLVWINFGNNVVSLWRNRPILFGFITMVFAASIFPAVVGLYTYKKDSADGRLLIWENAMYMMNVHPWMGLGPGQFAARYMHFQGDHFQFFEDSRQSILAGNTSFAFNEVLRIGVEFGLVGILFLAFFVLLFYNQKFRKRNAYVRFQICTGKAVLIGYGVFGLFSYPGSVLPLLLVFVMITGMLSNGLNQVITKIGRTTNSILLQFFRKGMIVSLCLAIFCYISFFKDIKNGYKTWETSIIMFETGDYTYDTIISKLESAYPVLLNNGLYLSMYGRILAKFRYYKRAIPILAHASEIAPTTQVFLDMGDSYKGIYIPDSAKTQYLKALRMIPGRIKPYYKLAQLYRELGQKEKMRAIINKYLHRRFIKRTLDSYEYELEMREWMKE